MARYNVPQDDRRGCLCRDGTYSTKCCGGDYYNQGIGGAVRTDLQTPTNLSVVDEGATVTLSWDVASFDANTDTWELEIYNSFDFLVGSSSGQYTSTTTSTTASDAAQNRYWRVRSVRGSETTEWVIGEIF